MNKILGNYVIQHKLGSGQFGAVYYCIDTKTNEEFAIKVIGLDKLSAYPRMNSLIKNEINALSKIDNPNIIKLKEFIQSKNNIYFVYEYCNGGTLEDYINKKKKLSEKEALYFLEQIINGFKSLVVHKVVHRDLKPANILIHNDVIKIADFGFCKPLETNIDLAKTMVGSPIYMAPEILKGEDYNIKADIWSIGVVLFEMLFGFCPYEDKNIYSLLNQINTTTLSIPKHINNISKSTENLLKNLLVVEPTQRIEWSEIINLNFYDFEKNMDWEKKDLNEENKKTSRILNEKIKYEIKSENITNFVHLENEENEKSKELRKFLKERCEAIFLLKTIETLIDEQIFLFLEYNEKRYILLFLISFCKRIYDDLIRKIKVSISTKETIYREDPEISELKVLTQTLKDEINDLNHVYSYISIDNEIPSLYRIKNIFENISKNFYEKIERMKYSEILKRDLIAAIYLADCLQIKKIISLFFSKNLKFSDQTYFRLIENYRIEDLLYLYLKKKQEISFEF